MNRVALLLTTVLFATVLLAGELVTATAEPQKNQIEVPVKCDNGQKYTLVFNGEGNAGHILEFEGPNNIIAKSYVIIYENPETGKEITRDEFDRGNRVGQQGDLIKCTGEITTEIFGLGEVRAVFEFEGLVTPRGK